MNPSLPDLPSPATPDAERSVGAMPVAAQAEGGRPEIPPSAHGDPDMARMMRRFSRAAIAVCALIFLQVVLGATVRATGSGMGCPDWPLCHGRFLPAMNFESILEYSHRLVAALVSASVMIMGGWIAIRRPLRRSFGLLASVMATMLVGLIVLGAITVQRDMPPVVVAFHLVMAAAFLASWLWIAFRALDLAARLEGGGSPFEATSVGPWRVLAPVTLGAAYVQLWLGALVSTSHAGLACPDFPTCYGMWVPPLIGNVGVQMIHRYGALTVTTLVATTVGLVEWRGNGQARLVARAAAMLVVAQVSLGIATVLMQIPVLLSIAHLATGMTLFATLFSLTWLAHRDPGLALPLEARDGEAAAPSLPSPPSGRLIKDFVQLMKPTIVLLVVLTGLPAVLIAAQGWPGLRLTFMTLLGTALAASSSAVFNQYFERESDKKMARTAGRPLPGGRVNPNAALAFGVALGIAAIALLMAETTPLAAAIAGFGLFFYGFFYTLVLKPTSPQNIVVGGAAGALAPLIAWAAVTGTVALPAWIMFAIVFLWTPPHFWALALNRTEEYARANIPMYPVVYGVPATTTQMLLYSVLLVLLSVLLCPLAALGPLYLVSALLLGGGFLALALGVHRRPDRVRAGRLFGYSIVYVLALFSVMTVDAAMGTSGVATLTQITVSR